MRGAVIHGPGDVRIEDLDVPSVVEPTDAVIEVAVACICESDLWPYHGLESSDGRPMGHEYMDTVTEAGDAVKSVKAGDFVVGSFCLPDNTCEIYRSEYQSRCANGDFVQGAQAQYARIPLAGGMLVVVPGGWPRDEATLVFLLAASDVLGTDWLGAVAADTGPGKTTAVVGNGAAGLMAVLTARQLGAERIVAMSCHKDRVVLARELGATDVVVERGDTGVAAVKESMGGSGAHGVVEVVGTQESMMQAIGARRPGGHAGYVGVSHDVSLPGRELLFAEINLFGGPAPVRWLLPDLVDRVLKGKIDPGKAFNLVLSLDGVAEGHKAIDERRAVKVLLQP